MLRQCSLTGPAASSSAIVVMTFVILAFIAPLLLLRAAEDMIVGEVRYWSQVDHRYLWYVRSIERARDVHLCARERRCAPSTISSDTNL